MKLIGAAASPHLVSYVAGVLRAQISSYCPLRGIQQRASWSYKWRRVQSAQKL
jgi:hypothetical protein